MPSLKEIIEVSQPGNLTQLEFDRYTEFSQAAAFVQYAYQEFLKQNNLDSVVVSYHGEGSYMVAASGFAYGKDKQRFLYLVAGSVQGGEQFTVSDSIEEAQAQDMDPINPNEVFGPLIGKPLEEIPEVALYEEIAQLDNMMKKYGYAPDQNTLHQRQPEPDVGLIYGLDYVRDGDTVEIQKTYKGFLLRIGAEIYNVNDTVTGVKNSITDHLGR